MKNYQITIGYKAVITVNVKAENEKDAKEKGLELFTKKGRGFKNSNIVLNDDTFRVDGVLDMDETWNML